MTKEIHVYHQKNAGRDFYYPANEQAEALTKLMQRKALVKADFEALKEFGITLGLEIIIKAVTKETEL